MAAIRLAINEPIRERPTAPAGDNRALAEQLTEASRRHLTTTRSMVASLIPGLQERMMEAIGPLGLRGWLLPAEAVPGVPGSGQVLREHSLLYTMAHDDAAVSPISDESEIPVEREKLGNMIAESYVRESPQAAARKSVRAALSDLIPRFNG